MVLNATKRFLLLIALLAAGLGGNSQSFAQQNPLFRTDYTELLQQQRNFQQALELALKSYEKNASGRDARRIAALYDTLHRYPEAFDWHQRIIKEHQPEREDYRAYVRAGARLDMPVLRLEQLLGRSGFRLSQLDAVNMAFMRAAQAAEPTVNLEADSRLNSPQSDFGLRYDSRGYAYWSSDRGTGGASKKALIRLDLKPKTPAEDFYERNNRDYLWIYRKSPEGEPEKLRFEGKDFLMTKDPSIALKSKHIFFTAVEKPEGRKQRILYPAIYRGELQEDGRVTQISPLPFHAPQRHAAQHPHLDEAGGYLYFASDQEGGFGGFDLYRVALHTDLSTQGLPENLGETINNAAHQVYPFLFGEELYFSSNQAPTLGGLDIFKAYIGENDFSQIQNLGTPFNSGGDDFGYYQNERGGLSISSDRLLRQGSGDNIYRIEDRRVFFTARFEDCAGTLMTFSEIPELLDRTKEQELALRKNRVGEFFTEVSIGRDFALRLDLPGYRILEDSSITSKNLTMNYIERTYRLQPILQVFTLLQDTIYYDLDRSFIRPEAAERLDQLAEALKRYPETTLLVASHTDSRASDAYNEALSERRALAVQDYLNRRHGIPASRLTLSWYGEQLLLKDCGDGMPCPEEEHQRNRRTELRLQVDPEHPTLQRDPRFRDLDPCDPEAWRRFFRERAGK
ncbi:OmpA/MotB domain-containing protein [Nitritalea halalkaliphila LW7]|uniref:OmpA/MotB domain-containing protein n=1 Tax=Nitritalea halalkaliphila LW7 TaxID=1189621 RepID=I5CAA9_9BACT|nr:OmpA family protein [Nitritalea halalkaliphila]EIM78761.1 OmpA/MotB domain-containing protein [Nitritalea halalkaliphila LW7]